MTRYLLAVLRFTLAVPGLLLIAIGLMLLVPVAIIAENDPLDVKRGG